MSQPIDQHAVALKGGHLRLFFYFSSHAYNVHEDEGCSQGFSSGLKRVSTSQIGSGYGHIMTTRVLAIHPPTLVSTLV